MVTALGAMSGTSLDGVDAAVLLTDGEDIQRFGPSGYRAYTPAEREIIAAALGHWEGPEVDQAALVVTAAHAELLGTFETDLVGFHGQTIAHDPGGRGTLQVGDGAALARSLGCPVVRDFRSADVAAGGEGAPLAPFFHHACARYAGLEEPVCFLNLGGVGNVTWVDPRVPLPETPGALLAFDTGPANAPINDLMQVRFGRAYDESGTIAAAGTINDAIIEGFMTHPYFSRSPPKSLDRNDFSDILHRMDHLVDADAVATITAICAVAVAVGMRHCPGPPAGVFVTGGGRHNPVLMEMISGRASCPVQPVETIGLDGDMLEAQAFAYLAVRVARGLATSAPGTTGVKEPVSGGVISKPS